MSVAKSLVVSITALGVLLLEVAVFVLVGGGYEAFHGDFRTLYRFMPIAIGTGAVIVFAPICAVIGRVVKKRSVHGWSMLTALVGILTVSTAMLSLGEADRIDRVEAVIKIARQALPMPSPGNADRSRCFQEILRLGTRSVWHRGS